MIKILTESEYKDIVTEASDEAAERYPVRMNRKIKKCTNMYIRDTIEKVGTTMVSTDLKQDDIIVYLERVNLGTKKFPDVLYVAEKTKVDKVLPKTIRDNHGQLIKKGFILAVLV